ncbi:hypothetical protein E7T09_04570 [Deinococcus sp. KSM4-11]|uniref:hypothetical protein n=1 Tax=Deinococcus sp. KSM4-11 TaxID=2568654 RepID=UPI0010A4A706|nr:hypothetical protein [Deinococcus sp. KSM4-11]THF88485.1 hypothetical protein E7T09_04570 [Deinococcus sp. KSM4-11]
MTHASAPLPPIGSLFAEVPGMVSTDCAELSQIPSKAISAGQRLDVQVLDALAARVATISKRHPMNLRVQHLVRHASNTVRFQRRKADRQLKGSGL